MNPRKGIVGKIWGGYNIITHQSIGEEDQS